MKAYKTNGKIFVSGIGIWDSLIEYDPEKDLLKMENFYSSLQDFFNLFCAEPEKHEKDFEYKKAYIEILNRLEKSSRKKE